MYLNINLSDAVMEPEDKSSSLEQFCAEELTKEQVREENDKSNVTKKRKDQAFIVLDFQ